MTEHSLLVRRTERHVYVSTNGRELYFSHEAARELAHTLVNVLQTCEGVEERKNDTYLRLEEARNRKPLSPISQPPESLDDMLDL